MSKKLPVISGKKLISCLTTMGYRNHNPIAKGTLNDILTKVSVWNQVPKEKLIDLL